MGCGIKKPGFFLASGEDRETGFLNQDFGLDANAVAETRFLGFGGGQETGFLNQDFGLDANAVAETRFLGFGGGQETGFLNQDFGLDANAVAETRFLGFGGGQETGFPLIPLPPREATFTNILATLMSHNTSLNLEPLINSPALTPMPSTLLDTQVRMGRQ